MPAQSLLSSLSLLLLMTPPAAKAGGWEAGGGVRDSTTEQARLEGLRVFGRHVFSFGGVELGVYGTPRADEVPDLGVTLLHITADASGGLSDFQYPTVMDRATLDLRLDLGAAPQDRKALLSGGPHLYVGAEVRVQERYVLRTSSVDPFAAALAQEELYLVAGPLVGVGLDAWYRGVVGLRLALTERTWIGRPFSYVVDVEETGRDLFWNPTANLDLLVAF